MEAVWVAMVADEWVAVVALFHSVLVIGNVVQKVAGITISQRMSAVCDVEPAGRVQQWWQIQAILLLWMLHRAMVVAWDLVLWRVLPDQGHLPSPQVDSDLPEGTVDNISAVLQAPMLSHLVSGPPLELTQL
jgi:hypothetical protein